MADDRNAARRRTASRQPTDHSITGALPLFRPAALPAQAFQRWRRLGYGSPCILTRNGKHLFSLYVYFLRYACMYIYIYTYINT